MQVQDKAPDMPFAVPNCGGGGEETARPSRDANCSWFYTTVILCGVIKPEAAYQLFVLSRRRLSGKGAA